MDDLKYAFRTLFRTPFLTAVAVLSLALGIGANAAIYSLLDQILLASLPVQEPERLVNLSAPGPKYGSQSCNQAGDCDLVFSHPMFRDLAEAETRFSGLAAHRLFGANLAVADRTVDGSGVLVSGSYFPTLGVRPAMGRLLSPADDRVAGEHPVAVLSHRFWQRELGGDPDVLNTTIRVNGNAMTVVGVAPPGFDGTTLGAQPDVFVPLVMRGAVEPGFEAGLENRRSYWAYVFGRLEPGATLEAAESSVNAVYSRIINEVEAPLQEGMSEQTLAQFREKRVTLEPGARGQSYLHGEARTPLLLLMGITGLVLLIACANIANLLLARGAGRAQELAVRGAVGANRSQLLKQLLTESLVLAALGGVASLFIARATLGLMGAVLPPSATAAFDLELRPDVLLFVAVVSIGTGLLFGMYPAVHSTRTDLIAVLRGDAGQPQGARSASRFRWGLVTAQIALSMALLIAAGLFIRSLVNVSRVDLGLETDRIVAFGISPALNGYEPAESRALFARAEEALAALPGVRGVAGGMVPLLAGSNYRTDVRVQGFESGPDIDSNAAFNMIGPGYFRTLGIPLIAGREFAASDDLEAPKVAIVNEAFAEKFGLGRDAVGQFMGSGRGDELDTEIVGLVQNAKYSEVKDEVPALFFRPYRQDEQAGFMTFYVRAAGPAVTVTQPVRDVMRRLDPNLPLEEMKTLEQQARENVYLDRMISTLAAAFAALATVLAAIGLYGVLAYSVAQRTREIGLRMALGSDRHRVRGLVLRQVRGMLIVGGGLGIIGAVVLGRAASSLLFGLEPFDLLTIAGATALLSLIAFGAALIPAYRASRVDPMQALRYE